VVERITRPRSQIVAGYASQQLWMRLHDRLVCFTAARESGEFPFGHPVIVASTSIHAVADVECAMPALAAVAVAGDRQWLDKMLVLPDSAAALQAASVRGGRFAMRWSEYGVAVFDLHSGLEVSHFSVRGREIVHPDCPVIPGDLCSRRGGPSVAMAALAPGHCTSQRRMFRDLRECDQDCPPPRSSIQVPTRYDTWVDEADLAQRESHHDGHCRIYPHDGQNWSGCAEPQPGVITVRTPSETRTLAGDDLIVVSKSTMLEMGESDVWEALSRLLIDPAGGPADPLDWSDAPLRWQTTDAELQRRCGGLRLLSRWVAIGPLRVTGVHTSGTVISVAFDPRLPGSGLLLRRTWLKISSLRVGEVGAVRFAISDDVPRIDVLTSSHSPCDVSAQWIIRAGMEALVAMVLEPYDPHHREASDDRRRHLALRAAAVRDAEFGLDRDRLRHRLREESGYESTREALQSPSSHPWFFEQLKTHLDGGGGPFRPV
jgi:hypothetical protein